MSVLLGDECGTHRRTIGSPTLLLEVAISLGPMVLMLGKPSPHGELPLRVVALCPGAEVSTTFAVCKHIELTMGSRQLSGGNHVFVISLS